LCPKNQIVQGRFRSSAGAIYANFPILRATSLMNSACSASSWLSNWVASIREQIFVIRSRGRLRFRCWCCR
jgi:hypothetical protein